MGGSSKSESESGPFDPESLTRIIQDLSDFSGLGTQNAATGVGGAGGIAGPQSGIPRFGNIQDPTVRDINLQPFQQPGALQSGIGGAARQLQEGGLTSEESASIQEQLRGVDLGFEGAQQDIQQSVRERATASGFGGDSITRGEIAEEAGRLGQIPLLRSQQRSEILGRAGSARRQGILAGAQFGVQERGQDVQSQLGLGQLGVQARGQDLSRQTELSRLGLQSQEFGQEQRAAELRLQLEALLRAGQLSGTGISSSESSQFSLEAPKIQIGPGG